MSQCNPTTKPAEMISRATATEVLAYCRKTIGLSGCQDAKIDDSLLAALARRSAGINCPCSRITLQNTLLECMQGLPTNYDCLDEAVNHVIEALIVGGDLLELADVIVDDSCIKSTWVFAAPPSFVVRKSGIVFLLGIVKDQDTFLPSTLTKHVIYRGFTRILKPQSSVDLPKQLKELGLQQLSEKAWLKSPKTEKPYQMLNRHKELLSEQPPDTEVPDLRILDFTRPVKNYRDRWTKPVKQDGFFIARRPQEFGAGNWCLVELQNGKPVRLLDLPLAKFRWRGCDAAWHLQCAIDHCRDTPQLYRRRTDNEKVRFDLFSPLPQWAERRLINLGESVPRDACLFSYVVPNNEAVAEEKFLQKELWLALDDDSC